MNKTATAVASRDSALSREAGNSLRTNHRIALALLQLPADLREVNRVYIDCVQKRALQSVREAIEWLGRIVTVFLRHDKVSVFAIESEGAVAMADFVTLQDATFHVNATGRQQSNAELGPLPNHRTVHAFLTGRLTEISNSGRLPSSECWEPVIYHPLNQATFVRAESLQSIHDSSTVRMVHGAQKVWCPRQTEHNVECTAKETLS